MLSSSIRRSYLLRELCSERADAAVDAALADQSAEAVAERCDRAWLTAEPDLLLEASFWLLRRGLISKKQAMRACQWLNELGRRREALAILADGRYARPSAPGYWCAMAAALAGADRLEEATQAFGRAVELDPEVEPVDEGFADALRLASSRKLPIEEIATWREAVDLVEACATLGLIRRAAETLASAFNRSLPQSEDEVLAALRLAQDILGWADPDLAAEILDGLKPSLVRLGLRPDLDPLSDVDPSARAGGGAHPGVQVCLAMALMRRGRHQAAAGLLQPFASHLKDREIPGAERARIELARAIGRIVHDEVRPRFGSRPRRQIVDMFPFNDELLMLEVKLEEMYDWVDRFVIVEAGFTFQGQPKPLHFERSRRNFAKFADKIVHVVVDRAPAWASTPWAREFYQRDSGLRALADICGADDLVLVTDVDEIVDRRAIEGLEAPFVSMGMPLYAYFFNLERIEQRQSRWSAALRARYLEKVGASYARFALPSLSRVHYRDNTGWHFSLVRDAAGLVSKFDSYSNTQWAGSDPSHYEALLRQIRKDRGLADHVRRDLDLSFPAYIRDNPEKFGPLIL